MSKKTVKEEEKVYNEIMSPTSNDRIREIKEEVVKLIPSDTKITAKNESQKKLINSIKNNEITICAGPAGTGKTYVAVAYALSLLRRETNRYKRIYLVKSVTTLKGEEIGFLKGDFKEKIDPFMWSFYINMEKIILESSVKILVDKEIVRPFPLAYMRGASLDDCIIIMDEAQNVSLTNSRTLMTRVGSNCKLIILGDTKQIDLKDKNESSLKSLIKLFKDVENIGIVEMSNEDTNVRNPIITIIENKFDEYHEKK